MALLNGLFPYALGLSGLIWLFLVVAWGQFWRCDQRLGGDRSPLPSPTAPPVAVVIPARNEAETISLCLTSLLSQDYPGPLHLVLVDDQSDDGTSDRAQEAAQAWPDRALTLIPGQPLPPGWTGKLWALDQGTRYAQTLEPAPTYILLTDADIAHDRHNLGQLVAKAETESLDLVSLMVQLRCQSPWERLLIPAFVYFFQQLYPFPWVNDRHSSMAAAAGGCVLLRTTALQRIGGIGVLRNALIDDCTLAAQVKGTLPLANQPRPAPPFHPIWLGLSPTTHSLRAYDTLESIWTMVARTAYTQLNYSPLLLLGTLLGMILVYLVAPLGLGWAIATGSLLWGTIAAATWGLMAFSYGPTVRLYGLSWGWAWLLPVIGLLYTLMTLDSARRHWQGQGGAWKGRVYGTHESPP